MGRLISYLAACILITVSFSFTSAQNITVTGNVSTTLEPVKYAQVTFTNINDTTKSFTTLTDTAGNYQLSIVITSVDVTDPAVPSAFELAQNYPNPFSNSTAITYKLNEQTDVSITIYNILGQEIKRYTMPLQHAGIHGITWNGTNNSNQNVSPGVYFYQIHNGKEKIVKKMVYGLGGSNVNPQISTYIQNSMGSLSVFSEGYAFNVEIKNLANTFPQIHDTVLSNIAFVADTIINLFVDKVFFENKLCYEKQDSTYQWEIFTNNIEGTDQQNISKFQGDDNYPKWSPDGRYIVYNSGSGLTVYDVTNRTNSRLPGEAQSASQIPLWTPEGKICFNVSNVWSEFFGTYLINPDGTGIIKILDTVATREIYFYKDNYSFLYHYDNSLYKTNFDNSYNEFITDLNNKYIYGFNPSSEELLISIDSLVGIFNIGFKSERIIIPGDNEYSYSRVSWSKDFSKLSVVETKKGFVDSTHDEYLSIFENGFKRRLVRITAYEKAEGYSSFGWHIPTFSEDGKYIAFSKLFVSGSGGWVSLWMDLYVVSTETENVNYIDQGWGFDWGKVNVMK